MAHHRRGLRRALRDDELLTRVEADWRTAGLGSRREAMLAYVERLTRDPAGVRRADVDALRAVGFEDADVLGICEVASYYAFANRIADGLGLEVEPYARS